jgi:hypothetical protein
MSLFLVCAVLDNKVGQLKLCLSPGIVHSFHLQIKKSDRHNTHLGDLDISFVQLNISSKFLLHLECYLLSP